MKDRIFPPWRDLRYLGFALALVLMAASGFAQFQTGNVYGSVVDKDDAALPGVTVTLSGVGAPKVFITDASGNFRFLNLDPGRYTVRAELAGFGVADRTVDVNVGRSAQLDVRLAPALEQTITVTAETPLLDVRKTGTGATMTKVELESIPTARDPWVVLGQVPGVLIDRINVGGNESGQQSSYVGKGATGSQSTWNLDGVNITDMGATGASPTYYDFDAFEEMQVTTGGTDPRVQTAGVNLNMVTKRGTNEFRGSGRFFLTDNDWQEEPVVPEEAQSYLSQVNEINHIEDFGLELGGPIVRDRLWVWAAYAEQNIENLAAAGFPELFHDDTFLKNFNFKLNAQIMANNSATGTYFEGSKNKFGRNVSPTRPPETAWNQGEVNAGAIIEGSPLWKIEDTHIFSPNFYLTGLYSKTDMSFFLTPVGGFDTMSWRDSDSVNHETFYDYRSIRPAEVYRLDGSSFFDTGSLNHELRFGFGYRETPTNSASVWPGGGRGYFDCGECSEADNFGVANLYREGRATYGSEYTDLYIGDTMLMGNWTFQAGLRYDLQEGGNFAATVPANPIYPEILPGATFTGSDPLEWSSISPRLGVTYAMGTTRRTLLRGAYNRYADQLGGGDFAFAHPFYYYQYLSYYWDDANANRRVERGEVLFDLGLYYFYLLNPNDPGSAESTARIDYDMDVPYTDEFIIGFEHELLPEFTVGMNYSHRTINNLVFTRYEKTQGAGDFYTAADYEIARTVTGSDPTTGMSWSLPLYGLKDGIDPPAFAVITNRPGYERTFDGIELLATKRLSNRWMMRGNIAWNDWKQNVDDEWAFYSDGDPTPRLPTEGYGCTTCDGEIVVEGSGSGSGAKGNVYINSTWSFNLTGLVQLPADFSIGANVSGREGYPTPYYHRANVGDGRGSKNYLIDGVDGTRLDDIMILDLRLGKEFRFMDRVGLNLSIDAFNVFDDRTILQREARLYAGATTPNAAANRIREILSPRVFRVGARLTF
jgi:hypothetical protein